MENEVVIFIKTLAIVISSCITIIGVPKAISSYIKKKKQQIIEKAAKEKAARDREDRQDADIAQIKDEFCLVMYGLSACLDGLLQQGCNHSVPEVKDKIDKYLNQRAHK